MGLEMMLSCTFGRSKGNHLYSSFKEGKTTNIMPVPPVLPFSPHAHSFGWCCQLRDGGSGRVHAHCVRIGGCSRDCAAGTVPAHVSALGRTQEKSSVAGPAPFLAAGIVVGPGQEGQCLEPCVYAHIYLHLYVDIPICLYTYTCMCVHNYGGGFVQLLISFLHCRCFLDAQYCNCCLKDILFSFTSPK